MTKTEAKELAQDLILAATEGAFDMIDSHGYRSDSEEDADLIENAMRVQINRMAKLFGYVDKY